MQRMTGGDASGRPVANRSNTFTLDNGSRENRETPKSLGNTKNAPKLPNIVAVALYFTTSNGQPIFLLGSALPEPLDSVA